jgi:transposase
MIVDEGLTVRQVAEIFGIHNSNVYRAIGGSIGGIYSDVQDSWKQNKKRSQYKKKESTNK